MKTDAASQQGTPRNMSAQEAAAYLGVSRQRLSYLVRRGTLLASKGKGRTGAYVIDGASVESFAVGRSRRARTKG